MEEMETMSSTFCAALRSVGTAATVAAAGFYLHRRKFITLGEKRALARMSQQVTIPALFFTKIIDCTAATTSAGGKCPSFTENLADIWFLVFWPLYVVGCGLFVGAMAARISGTPQRQRPSVLAACAFGNSTGVPITLLNVIHSNFPKTSEIGRNDPTLLLSVYLILYPVLQWGVGGWLLSPTENDMVDSEIDVLSPMDSNAEDMYEQPEASNGVKDISISDRMDTHRRHVSESESEGCAARHRLKATADGLSSATNPCCVSTSPLVDAIVNSLPKACQPPVIAAVMGLFIAAVDPLRALFVDLKGHNIAPLEFLFDGLTLLGKAAVPINMVILGINLSVTSRLKLAVNAVSIKSTTAIVISKLIVMPCIGVLSAITLKNYIWNIPDAIDGPFYLVLMIVTITPTANTVMVMVELSDSDAKEGIARILFWEYVFAPILLTVNVMIVVHIAGLW